MDLTCPHCDAILENWTLGQVEIHRCPQGHGVFLDRADLGSLIDAENEWHRSAAHQTQPLPRITPDMTAPPPSTRARAFVETLFAQ